MLPRSKTLLRQQRADKTPPLFVFASSFVFPEFNVFCKLEKLPKLESHFCICFSVQALSWCFISFSLERKKYKWRITFYKRANQIFLIQNENRHLEAYLFYLSDLP